MSSGPTKRGVVFVYANDPEPILLERMSALESTGRYEVHAVYWHRIGSPLSIPWSTGINRDRFHQIELPDPRGGIFRRLFLTFRFGWQLRKQLNSLKPDIVTPIYQDMLFATKLAMFIRPKIVTFYELWDLVGPARPGRLSRMFQRRLFRGVSSLFVTSRSYESQYLAPNQLVAHGTRVKYASNAPVDWNFRVPDSPDPGTERPLTVAYIGQIRVAPQLRNLIAAVRSLNDRGVEIKLLIAGGGEDSAWLEHLSKENEFIDFRGAFDFQRDAEELYSLADLMFAVYPQKEFNYRVHWARRAHQAILSGIPLIVSEGSEMGDYVETHDLGWTVGDESQVDLELLVADIAANPSQLASYRTDSEVILREHRFETFQDSVVAEYDSNFD
jgi:glycosyltransferase involved in cell wall biosynthesis